MKKLFLFLVCFSAATVFAQKPVLPGHKNLDRTDAVSIGLKGGICLPHFHYTDENVSDIPHDLLIRPAAGIFVEIPIGNFSISPQVLYACNGSLSTYRYKNQYDVRYQALTSYVDVRLAAAYRLRLSKMFHPYLFVAPGMGVLLFNGSISLEQPGLDIPEVNVELSDANMNNMNAFVAGGIGMQANFCLARFSFYVKLDAGYNFGFVNTFSKKEIDEIAHPTNIHAYNNTGKRFTRGYELMLSIGLPLKFDSLKCNGFGQTVYNKKHK